MKVQLKGVRLAFFNGFEARTMPGQKNAIPKFNTQIILDPAKHKAEIAALDAAVLSVAEEKWTVKAKQILAHLVKEDMVCYRKGPKLNSSGDVYEGFEGMHYVSASTSKRPLIIDRDKSPLTAADGRPYSGCYANVSIEVWPQDNEHGKRINAELKGVQFVKDGDAFGGGTPSSPEEFDDLGVEQEEELV